MNTPPTSVAIRTGRFFFKYRDLLFPLVFLPLALLVPPRAPGVVDVVLSVLGLLVVFGGQGLRSLVIGLAYIRRGGKNKEVYADELVQDGIFAHSRNPLYLGNLLIVCGLALLHGGLALLLGALPFFLIAYLTIVAAEEAYLRDRFGAPYEDYCRRVPRFRVRLAGLSKTVHGMRFQWRRLARKEYGTFFSTASAVLGILALKRVAHVGFAAARGEVFLLVELWLVAAVAWGVVRYMKKSGALEDRPTTGHAETAS